MNNCGFRNAVIGKNEATDPKWPMLNESNKISKRRNKPAANSTLNTLGLLVENPSSGFENDIPTEQLKTVDFKDHSQMENSFPSLTKSIKIKKVFKHIAEKEPSNYNLDCNKTPRKQNYAPRKIRVPKFRNEISVSLSSLIKPPVPKNKLLCKKVFIKNRILIGNKLDSDRPIRRKGKSHLVKKKYLTQYKKVIILSRSLKKKDDYNECFHKVKCLVPSVVKNDFNINKLQSSFELLSIEDCKIKCFKDHSNPEISTLEIAKTLLHSRKFPKYCTNLVSTVLLKNTENLVVRLRNLQNKQHAKDPSKTFSKRRYLCGFRETKRFILCGTVKAVIIATDLEIDTDLPSGLPLNEIKTLAEERSIPVVFAGKLKQLGYWTIKKQKISIISILRYEGAEQLYDDFIKSWEENKESYENIIKEIQMLLPKSISSKENISQDVEQEIRDNIISKLSGEIVDFKEDSQ
ncbi:selenocysteine insertion sequence-binding protein 2 [Halyomorpha halys]|uniref:selenocysteine insertion sequence-binding protein 2 n=1 Tax=Halyomorpha halys TaxID=286706 RepID=UPI0006D4CD73|nr:selenocysteine insertion sequence-binding protein 2-like [Halyomorpha halys]